MKIYLASSWKNEGLVIKVAKELRKEGHEVDAFVDTDHELSIVLEKGGGIDIKNLNCKEMLIYPNIIKAFKEDKKWLDYCCIMLLPWCGGNSSHLEAGYTKGSGKKLIIYNWSGLEKGEFDVMWSNLCMFIK